ncbi:MAG: hypothetical protein KDB71_03380 [Mycobacterium sp.]|nr:hypothetical protein [Mycobacterium sp.]
MRVVAALALAASFALVVALLGGGTWFAFLVIALAGLGIVLLARDWRTERARGRSAIPPQPDQPATGLLADELSPDISTFPDGPSSDARAD